MLSSTARRWPFRWGHAVFCWLVVGFLSVSGCGPDAYRVDVDVAGLSDDVVRLSVIATFGGQRAASSVSQSLDHFALRLLSDKIAPGVLNVTVSGLGSDGCQRSSATAQVILPTEMPIAVTLTPDRGCKIVVTKIGDGQGQVKTPDEAFTCKFDGAPAHDPLCTTDVPGACALCLPLGAQVTLDAFAEQSASPRAYFGGWTGACTGKASCQLPIGAGKTEVGAGFLPTQACSVDGFCWEHPLPQGHHLVGAWGFSADDVWFVGDAGTILHWNGIFFAAFSSGTTADLSAVWGSSSTNLWAVGTVGTILHYDGTSWMTVESRGPMDTLWGVWGSSPSDVWAVGKVNNVGIVLHYDGTSWLSAASVFTFNIRAVWGSGPNDVWALGDDIQHYDGSAWSLVPKPISSGLLTSVWGSGPKDIWAAYGDNIVHYDGTSWRPSFTTGLGGDFFQGVWGSGPKDVWAIQGINTIIHYDGSSWQTYRNSTDEGSLNALWGSGPGDVWAIGEPILHLNGIYWAAQNEILTRRNLQAVWGENTGLRNVWAVGDAGTIMHYNGFAWSLDQNPATAALLGVWGSGPTDVWAIGGYGTILHYDGASWTSVTSGTMQYLGGVWGSGPKDVWAVGDNGTILHYTGAGWTLVASPTKAHLSQLWGSRSNDIWAVGASSTILHYDGNSWKVAASGPGGSLLDIWGSGASDVWAVGSIDAGTILHYDGTKWLPVPNPPTEALQHIWGSGPTDLWVWGRYAGLSHWDGTSFKAPLTETTQTNLRAGWSAGPGDTIFVGAMGTILHRSP